MNIFRKKPIIKPIAFSLMVENTRYMAYYFQLGSVSITWGLNTYLATLGFKDWYIPDGPAYTLVAEAKRLGCT